MSRRRMLYPSVGDDWGKPDYTGYPPAAASERNIRYLVSQAKPETRTAAHGWAAADNVYSV
ncbi:MAG: hypothetical protein JW837_02580 [Sedimentisphaerales bacterium]|nr:hypothetical protein [Sedimentisphaerales bacterium]